MQEGRQKEAFTLADGLVFQSHFTKKEWEEKRSAAATLLVTTDTFLLDEYWKFLKPSKWLDKTYIRYLRGIGRVELNQHCYLDSWNILSSRSSEELRKGVDEICDAFYRSERGREFIDYRRM